MRKQQYIKFYRTAAAAFKSQWAKNLILAVIAIFCLLSLGLFFQARPVCRQKIRIAGLISQCIFFRGSANEKIVFLTFDDGPDPVNSPQILKILEKQKIKATFFLIGEQVEKYPLVAQQIAEAGQGIGSHGYGHIDYNNHNHQQILQDIRLAQRAISRATRITPVLLRPPFGRVNAEIASMARSERLNIVLWSLDPKDFRQNANREQIKSAMDSQISNGSIILLHETSSETIAALPEIIISLKDKGYLIESIWPAISK